MDTDTHELKTSHSSVCIRVNPWLEWELFSSLLIEKRFRRSKELK